MKKRILSILIAIVMVVGVLPGFAVTASAATSAGTTGDCTWTLDSDGVFTVSGNGAMGNYYIPEVPYVSLKDQIKKVVIGSGVTTVGTNAFNGCADLIEVILPDTVTKVYPNAFKNASALSRVEYWGTSQPESIGSDAFSGCDLFSVVNVPATYTGDTFGEWPVNKNLIAPVTPTAYTVTVTADPAEGGTVTGGGTYSKDDTVTVTATANDGYTFKGWTENGNEVSTEASYTFTASADRTLAANFEEAPDAPSGTVTIYFNNTANWTDVYAYYWGSDNTEMAVWPGAAMTRGKGTVCSVEIPAAATMMIFSSGNYLTATADLTIPTDGKNFYDFTAGTWSVYGASSEQPDVPETYDLTISVVGPVGEDKSVDVRVVLDDTTISGTYGDVVFEYGVAAVCSEFGETKTAAGLPKGVVYSVTASGPAGYEKTGEVSDQTLTADAAVTLTYTKLPAPAAPNATNLKVRNGIIFSCQDGTGDYGKYAIGYGGEYGQADSYGEVYEKDGVYYCDTVIGVSEAWEYVESAVNSMVGHGEHRFISEDLPETVTVKLTWSEEEDLWYYDQSNDSFWVDISCKEPTGGETAKGDVSGGLLIDIDNIDTVAGTYTAGGGTVTVAVDYTNKTVTVTLNNAEIHTNSYGIWLNIIGYDLTVIGAENTANSITGSNGIYAYNDVTVIGTVGSIAGDHFGIVAEGGSLILSDANIAISGGDRALYGTLITDYTDTYQWKGSGDGTFTVGGLSDSYNGIYLHVEPAISTDPDPDPTPVPKITGVTFNTDSPAYNAATNTFTLSNEAPMEITVTGENLTAYGDDFGWFVALVDAEYTDIFFSYILFFTAVTDTNATAVLTVDEYQATAEYAVTIDRTVFGVGAYDLDTGDYDYVTVNFAVASDTEPTAYTVTVTADPAEGGTVTGGGTYSKDDTVTVTAAANDGYTFKGWTENGNEVSTDASYTFTASADRALAANFEEAPATNVAWTVVGMVGLCGSEWDVADSYNDMTDADGDGIYTKVYEGVNAGTYEFKVVKNHSWNECYPENNYRITVAENGATVTVYFNSSTKEITVDGVDDNLLFTDLYVAGNGSGSWLNGAGWDPADASNKMSEVSDGIYEITYTGVSANDEYEFKIAADGAWTVNWGGTYSESGVEFDGIYGAENICFSVAEDSSAVTVRVDATDTEKAGDPVKITVTVTPPSGGTVTPAITDVIFSDYSGDSYSNTVTVDAENKTYTVTIPADADTLTVTVTVKGEALDKITDDDKTAKKYRILTHFVSTINAANTYNASAEGFVIAIKYYSDYLGSFAVRYSNDGGATYTETGWTLVVQKEEPVTYPVTVTDGVCSDGYYYEEGATVTVTANAPEEGYVFTGWTSESGVTFADASAATTTFTMPAKEVKIKANYAVAVAMIGDTKYASFEDAVEDIATDGSDTTIKLLTDIEVSKEILFGYGTGKVIITADKPVTVRQTANTCGFYFIESTSANIVVDKNVTFELSDNASDFAVWYGASLTVDGTIVGGNSWGSLYLFYGEHLISDTGKVKTGRVQTGFSELTVNGEIDTNYLLVEESIFTADGAVINVDELYDSNRGSLRYGASVFNVKNGSEITAATLTIGHEDSVLNVDATSKITASTVAGKGTIVVDAKGMSAGKLATVVGDASDFEGEIKLINNTRLYADIDEDGNIILVEKTYPITVEPAENGEIDVSDLTPIEDEKVTVTVSPAELYRLDALTVDGVDVTDKVVNGKYEFEMPAKAVTVTASFELCPLVVTWLNANGDELEKDEDVAYGTAPSYDGETPVYPNPENGYSYRFLGWSTSASGEALEAIPSATGDTVYYAVYAKTAKTFLINWIVKGYNEDGSNAGFTQSNVKYGDPVSAPEMTWEREGYVFSGWEDVPETMPADNVVIYGEWVKNFGKITWMANGQTYTTTDQTFSTAIALPDGEPVRTGYTFKGWYKAETGGEQVTAETVFTENNDTTVYYAQWEPNVYQVNWRANGGCFFNQTYLTSTVSDQTFGAVIAAPPHNAYAKRVGHTFAGWNTRADGTGETLTAETVMSAASNTAVIYYAQWTVNEYTVTFDTDGGTAVAPITLSYGTAIIAPPAPTKRGYTFAYWDEAIPETMPAENITVIARWDPATDTPYTVKHLIENASGDGYTQYESIVMRGTTGAKTEAEPRPYIGLTAQPFEQLTILPDGSTAVEIKYDRDTYSVTLITDNGTIHSGNVTEYVYGVGAKLPTAVTKPGHTFGGWYETSSFSGSPVTEIAENAIGPQRFYAKWNVVYVPVIPSNPTYPPIVNEADNGGVKLTPSAPKSGTTVTVTPEPDAGYATDTVTVTDRNGKAVTLTDNGDGTYSFVQPSGSVTVTVTFKPSGGSCTRGSACPMYGYTDLDRTLWYHDGIHFCIEKDLMVGIGNGLFDPNGTLTRAMAVTMLWRLEGSPVVNYAMSFEDVPADEWYTEAIRWAESENIVEGYGNGEFGTEDPVTREQLAAILYRFEQKHGGGFTGAWMLRMDYADLAEVSDWAYEAVCWMTMNSVIEGKPEKLLDPKGTATRAEAAAMLQRYVALSAD